MLKLCRVTKVKVFFLVLVYVFNFDLFEFSDAILEKGLFLERGFKKIVTSLKILVTNTQFSVALVTSWTQFWTLKV